VLWPTVVDRDLLAPLAFSSTAFSGSSSSFALRSPLPFNAFPAGGCGFTVLGFVFICLLSGSSRGQQVSTSRIRNTTNTNTVTAAASTNCLSATAIPTARRAVSTPR
jgi:hypothetical protein